MKQRLIHIASELAPRGGQSSWPIYPLVRAAWWPIFSAYAPKGFMGCASYWRVARAQQSSAW